jgi:hypothetical protein
MSRLVTKGNVFSNRAGEVFEWTPVDTYEDPFKKLITDLMESDKISQEERMKFFYASMDVKEFRRFIHKNYPQYSNRIKLWEILHGEERVSA